jgi:hypothetical protein
MRTMLAMALLAVTAGICAAQDDRDKKVAEQKKQAEAVLKTLEMEEHAFVETKHLLIYAPKAMEKQMKAKGAVLENYHDQAVKATALDVKEGYPGKITVYLLADRDQAAVFIRRVEGRRPMTGETGGFKASDDDLHAAGCAIGTRVPAEARAGEMLAAVILQRKAGKQTVLPEWLIAGFGRATSYQVLPKEKFVAEDRKLARVLVRRRDADAIWGGTLEPEEVDPLQGSLAELLAYSSSGRKYFPKFVAGFAPGENLAAKTTPQALEAAGLPADRVARAWKGWVK